MCVTFGKYAKIHRTMKGKYWKGGSGKWEVWDFFALLSKEKVLSTSPGTIILAREQGIVAIRSNESKVPKKCPKWEKFLAILFIANGTGIFLKASYITKVPLSKISGGANNFPTNQNCDEI